MPEIEIGQPAPKVSLPRDGGGQIDLSEYSGKNVVLFFYPRDDTSGCTKEAIGFSEHMQDFESENTVVIGISKDTVKNHDKFIQKHELHTPLLSDHDNTVCEQFGVWVEKSMYGKKYMGIERSTFLIDGAGVVREIWRKVKVTGHVEAVLKRVRSL